MSTAPGLELIYLQLRPQIRSLANAPPLVPT